MEPVAHASRKEESSGHPIVIFHQWQYVIYSGFTFDMGNAHNVALPTFDLI
jgi:hypothetical protein